MMMDKAKAKPGWRQMVVRVVLQPDVPTDEAVMNSLLIECLRYAGLLQIHETDGDHLCFDILPPKHIVVTGDWAKANAERMRSFGLNAEAAPKWTPMTSPAIITMQKLDRRSK
jgi:hypothetical protein